MKSTRFMPIGGVKTRPASKQRANRTVLHAVALSLFAMTVLAPRQLIHAAADHSPANAASTSFFVSPRGNDNWSGKLAEPRGNDGPFATMARARDVVRSILKAPKPPEGIRVVLRGGTYHFESPLEFGPEDSGRENTPVVYAAAEGEKVVLSAGRRLEC